MIPSVFWFLLPAVRPYLWMRDLVNLSPQESAERVQVGKAVLVARVWVFQHTAPGPLAIAARAPEAQEIGLIGAFVGLIHSFIMAQVYQETIKSGIMGRIF